MQHWKLTQWCNRAVSKLSYPPDRYKVYWELHQHLDDRCDSFLAQGMNEEDAVNKAVAAMGDPAQLAPWLARIHKPWFAWTCSLVKWLSRLAILALVVAVIAGCFRDVPLLGSYRQHDYSNYDQNPYDHPDWQVYHSRDSFSDSGYTVALDTYSVNAEAVPTVFFQLKITSLLPWAPEPEFTYWLEAKDSLGRSYAFALALNENDQTRDRYVSGILYHSGPCTWTYHGSVHIDDARNVSWIDLQYRQDGRYHTLRIDLKGGAT